MMLEIILHHLYKSELGIATPEIYWEKQSLGILMYGAFTTQTDHQLGSIRRSG